MPFSLRKLSKLNLIALCVVAMIAIATLGFGFRTLLRPVKVVAAPQQSKPEAAAPADTITYFPVEEITLHPEGFYPLKLSHPKGKFLLNVCNRAGLVEANFSLVRVVGNGTKEKVIHSKVHQSVLDWSSVLDLNPGSYLLTEDSNPKWSCELTITAK